MGKTAFFPISTPSSHISKTDFPIPSSNRCTHLQQLWQHGPEHSGGCGSAHGCPPLRPSGPPRPPTALTLQWRAPASCVGLGWPLHCPWLQSGRLWHGSWRWRWWASGWRWRWVGAAWCCLAHGGPPPSAPHRKAQQRWHHLPQQDPVSPWQRGQHRPGSACALPHSEQPGGGGGGSARVWNVWAGTKARQGPRRVEQRRRLRRKEGKKKKEVGERDRDREKEGDREDGRWKQLTKRTLRQTLIINNMEFTEHFWRLKDVNTCCPRPHPGASTHTNSPWQASAAFLTAINAPLEMRFITLFITSPVRHNTYSFDIGGKIFSGRGLFRAGHRSGVLDLTQTGGGTALPAG